VTAGASQPVPHAEVSLDQGGKTTASDSGEFRVDLGPQQKPGFPATFHVKNWVIVDPYVLARGRTYLPDPAAEPMSIRVLPLKDPGLVSDAAIRNMLLEKFARFPDVPGATSSLRQSPRLQLVAWPQGSVSSPAEAFLDRQAAATGLSGAEIEQALSAWRKAVADPYGKGLALLYTGQARAAIPLLSEGARAAPFVVSRLIPLALAQYTTGDSKAAAANLGKVLAVQPNDDILRGDLAKVNKR
jgi:hypothetical protein